MSLQGMTKQYPGVRALDNVDLNLRAGTIHGLTGENGAGKSTLIKILGGATIPDRGKILFEGEVVKFNSPISAIKHGISIVHQELIMATHLSVMENIFLGQLTKNTFEYINWKSLRNRARELLDQIGLNVDERTIVSELSLGQQQLVEIARALSRDVKLLVLDEPSAILGGKDLEILFDVVRSLRKKGVSVVYISHRLKEVLELSDEISVLRDGKMQGTKKVAELDESKLIIMMTGRKLVHPSKNSALQKEKTLIEVKQKSEEINLKFAAKISVRAGEIVGLAGLVGSGRTNLALNIFGAQSGTYEVTMNDNVNIRNNSTRAAKRLGIAYLPKDRKNSGLLMNRSIRENVGLASLKLRSFAGVLHLIKDRTLVKEFTNKVLLKSSSLEDLPTTLSGGNQQKVMLARWLSVSPTILILDEPTRGVDVVGKSEIYRLIRQLTDSGRGILMISSEIEEIISMSDRVYVMSEGKVVAELVAEDITENNIARASLLGRKQIDGEING